MNRTSCVRHIRLGLKIAITLGSIVILWGVAECIDNQHVPIFPLVLVVFSTLLILASLFGGLSPRSHLGLGILASFLLVFPTAIFLWIATDSADSWYPVDARPLTIPPALLLALWWLLALLSWRDGFVPFARDAQAISVNLWRNRKRVALTLATVSALGAGAYLAITASLRHRNCITYTFPDGTPAAYASVMFDHQSESVYQWHPILTETDAKGRVFLTPNQARGGGWEWISVSVERDGKRYRRTVTSIDPPETLILEEMEPDR